MSCDLRSNFMFESFQCLILMNKKLFSLIWFVAKQQAFAMQNKQYFYLYIFYLWLI